MFDYFELEEIKKRADAAVKDKRLSLELRKKLADFVVPLIELQIILLKEGQNVNESKT